MDDKARRDKQKLHDAEVKAHEEGRKASKAKDKKEHLQHKMINMSGDDPAVADMEVRIRELEIKEALHREEKQKAKSKANKIKRKADAKEEADVERGPPQSICTQYEDEDEDEGGCCSGGLVISSGGLVISAVLFFLFVICAITQRNDKPWLAFYSFNAVLVVASVVIIFGCKDKDCRAAAAYPVVGCGGVAVVIWCIVLLVGSSGDLNGERRKEAAFEITGASLSILSALYHLAFCLRF